MARIINVLLLASMTVLVNASFSCTGTYCPDYTSLYDIFVSGSECAASSNILTAAQLNQIKMQLSIHFNQPNFILNGNTPVPYSSHRCPTATSDISCPAQSFHITPGMNLSSVLTRERAFDTTSGNTTGTTCGTSSKPGCGYYKHSGPTLSFTTTPGKKYSVLMVDCFSKATQWNSMPGGHKHFEVLNMAATGSTLTSVQQQQLASAYADPGNPVVSDKNVYFFTVWEHTADVTTATWGQGSAAAMQNYLTATGLANAQLVAINYMRVYGSIYSRMKQCISKDNFCLQGASTYNAQACQVYSSSMCKICSTYGSTVAQMCPAVMATTTTTVSGSGSTQTSRGALQVEVGLLTSFALAVSFMHSFAWM